MIDALPDVGLAGGKNVPVELISGQKSLPQALSVGQQPPPSDAGHDLKPDEQLKPFGLDVLGGGVIVELELVVIVVGRTGVIDALVEVGGIVDDKEDDDRVGVTTT